MPMQGPQEADEPLDGGRSVRGWRFPRPGRLTYGKVRCVRFGDHHDHDIRQAGQRARAIQHRMKSGIERNSVARFSPTNKHRSHTGLVSSRMRLQVARLPRPPCVAISARGKHFACLHQGSHTNWPAPPPRSQHSSNSSHSRCPSVSGPRRCHYPIQRLCRDAVTTSDIPFVAECLMGPTNDNGGGPSLQPAAA
jgi:hypothetical protein